MLQKLRTQIGAGLLVLLLACIQAAATEQGAEAPDADWPDWVNEQEALQQRIAAVNEGELAFVDAAQHDAVHYQAGRVAISEDSLVDGWVVLEQCHENLDRVAAAQILFHPRRSRALEVVSFSNIDQVYPEGSTIQLRGVRAGSRLCLRAQSKALQILGPDVFELHNGPFMRQFLDGFYPLRLSLQIDYPPSLMLADFDPAAQPGFRVSSQPGRINLETVFEGRLHTRFRFMTE